MGEKLEERMRDLRDAAASVVDFAGEDGIPARLGEAIVLLQTALGMYDAEASKKENNLE